MTFHLASGALLGVFASLILLALIIGRRLRGRTTLIAALGISTLWSWALAFGRDLLLRPWFVGYAVVGALIGMAWVYKRPFDQRDQTLLALALRGSGLLCLFFSTLVWEYALLLPLLALVCLFVMRLARTTVPRVYRRFVRPPKRMLSEAEYRRVCEETTERELRKLREHLETNTSWMTRVQPDTHNRVREFLDHKSHAMLFSELDPTTVARQARTPPSQQRHRRYQWESSSSSSSDYSDGEGPDRLYPVQPYVPVTPPRTPKSPRRLDGMRLPGMDSAE